MKLEKISRKAISVMLAFALVLSCVTISLTVFASVSPFKVPKESPAVPLFKGKAIELENLSVEIGGTFQSGETLTWTKKSGSSAKKSGTQLVASAVGNTRFEVSDASGNKQNVWVLVNAVGNTDFALANIDFENSAERSLTNWVGSAVGASNAGGIYTSGAYQMWSGAAQPIAEQKETNEGLKWSMKVGSPNSQLGNYGTFLCSTALKDFSDYSVIARLSQRLDNKRVAGHSGIALASGIFVRTTLSSSASSTNVASTDAPKALASGVKSLHIRFRNYGGIMLNAYDCNGGPKTSPSNYLYGDSANMYYTNSALADDLWVGGDDSKVFGSNMGDEVAQIRKIRVDLEGTGIRYSIDDNVIFDTIADNDVYGMFTSVNGFEKTEDSTGTASTVKVDEFPAEYKSVGPISHEDYVNAYNTNLQAQNGTIGFSSCYGNIVSVYSVKVIPSNFDENSLPVYVGDEQPASNDIPVNTRYNLALEGNGIIWSNIRTNNYEVANGILSVYSKPANGKIVVYGMADEKGISKTFNVLDAGTETKLSVTKFADANMTIVPIANQNNTYKVCIDTANANEVKHGTILLNDGETQVKVYNGIIGSNKGNEFEFTAYNPSAMSLSAVYTTREVNEASIYNLGTNIRLESNKNGAGVRFLTRIPAITKDVSGAINIADTITVGGAAVTPDEVGTLLLPTELLGGKELKFPTDYKSGDLYINGNKVRKSVITNLAKVTDKYSDAYTTLGELSNEGFGFDPLDIDISTVAYIKYHDASGNVGFVYSNVGNASYNEVLAAAFPLNEDDETVSAALVCGTNHSLDDNIATNDISYAVGEDIIFSYRISGAYTADWKLCKDIPASNVTGTEKYTENAENIVASGSTQQGENVFTVSTKMNKPGTVKLVITVTDSYGNPVTYANGKEATVTTVVAAGAEDIKQPLEAAGLLPVNSATALNNMYKSFSSRATVIKGIIENNKSDLASFLTTAAAGQSKSIDNKLTLTCASVADGYRYFDFAIATDDTVGVKTTEANGLFANGNYNKRPATGSLVIPTAVSSLNSLVANYQNGSDAGAHNGGIANTVIVNTNMHGYDNAKAAADAGYIDTLESTSIANGGIKNFLTAETEKSFEEPNDSYAYGVIYRDYLALQTARKLFKVIMNQGPAKVTTNGCALGGWQSILVSALDTEITNTNADAPYFASLGGTKMMEGDAQDIGNAFRYFSSASAAQRIAVSMGSRPSSYTIAITGELADTVAPANGIISIYAALKNANCNKSITMKQFSNQGTAPLDAAKVYDAVLSGEYDSTEKRSDINTSYKDNNNTEVPTSPTRSNIVVGGDFIYDRSNFKVPAKLMTTEQYQAKIDSLLTSADSKTNATEAYLNELDNLDLMLQDQIVYNSDNLVDKNSYAHKYYVSSSTGSDSNSGTSPEQPWKSIRKVNTASIPANSVVSFKRGDIFYGILQPKSGIDYGTYGTGYKPQLRASYEANSMGWKWVKTNVDNIWKLDHQFVSDPGANYGLNFSLDMIDALSVSTMIDKDGNQAVVYHKDWVSEIDHNYQYVYVGPNYNKHKNNLDSGFAITCNPNDNYFYMYCDEGNPGELFKEIHIGLNSSVLNENNKYIENIHVDNLELLFGRGPFWPGNCKNIEVTYCTCGWSGGFDDGTQTHDVQNLPTPYGGGGGVYGTCDNFVWDHCYIFQQWDSGLSAQANHNTETEGATHYKDFITTNCLFKGTKWTLELWLNINATNLDTIEHMVFDYNMVRDTGYGFNDFECEASACVEMWGYSNECHNCSIQHNVFDRPYDYIYHNISGYSQDDSYITVYTFDGTTYMPTIDYNICIQTKGKHLGKINRMMDKNYASDLIYYFNDNGITNWQNFGFDVHGLFLYADR